MKQGLYRDYPVADYFADPAPAPSLTQSIAKLIIERSPLHAWHAHPRLNPKFEPDDATKYDLGTVAHALMIGRGRELVILDAYDDWRTNEAKRRREEAREEGRLAVLGKHFNLAVQMTAAARVQLSARKEHELFRAGSGAGEVMTLWKEHDIWLRQLIDWLTDDHLTFCDYKTTAESAAPQALGRKMAADGWHIQAAMAERGLNAIEPKAAGRRRYLFVVQETDEPYALNVVEITEGALLMGRKMLNYAVDHWRACIKTGTFPAYPPHIVRPEFPGWAETEWLNREIMAEGNVLMAG